MRRPRCAGGRTFLEVERYDRVGELGRRGTVSLATLDAEFTGFGADWVTTVEALVRVGRVPSTVLPEVALRAAFGGLIGNTDMHRHNLEFFTTPDLLTDGVVVEALTPVFDMLPMSLAPRGNEIGRHQVALPPVRLDETWQRASGLALTFWQRVGGDERVSLGMRDIARRAARALERRTA